jgi:hypothetical protein
MLVGLSIVSAILAVAWNWKGFHDHSRSAWGTPGYIFAVYGAIFAFLLIFGLSVFLTEKLGLYTPTY